MPEPNADRPLAARGESPGWLLELGEVIKHCTKQRAHAGRQREAARAMRREAHAMRDRSRTHWARMR